MKGREASRATSQSDIDEHIRHVNGEGWGDGEEWGEKLVR